MKKKQTLVYWWLPLLALCLIAYWIQINIYLHKDVAILSHTAAQMLQGQTYAHDIFEPNPPIIFYLHMPPVLIAKMTGIKIIYVLRIYLIALITLSVSLSHLLFKKIFNPNNRLLYSMSYALACILLFLPMEAFGQREHFLCFLTTPYLLLAACRLEHKPISKSFAMLIGLMAGLGFCIKPFFLPTLILIELFFIYRQKNLFGWLRIESIIATLFILFYGLSVILFYPTYWHIVLPIWLPYYRAIARPWVIVLTYSYFLFCSTALALSCLTKKNEPHSAIKIIFSLALIGFLITFLIPRVAWYYHILPAFSIACLYFVLIFGELTEQVTQSSGRMVDWGLIGLLGITVFSKPVFDVISSTNTSVTYFHSSNPLSELTTFLNQHEPNNSYDFFSMTHQLYDLEFYSTANYIGSFPFFGWEFNRLLPTKYPIAYRRKTLSFALNIVSHDLDDKKPAFVIVDNPSSKDYLNQFIDYPKEYASNTPFREAWSHYTYCTTIGPYEIYQRRSANR